MRKDMDHLGFYRNLDLFDFTKNKLPELSIKTIELECIIKRCTRLELMDIFRGLKEAVPVAA